MKNHWTKQRHAKHNVLSFSSCADIFFTEKLSALMSAPKFSGILSPKTEPGTIVILEPGSNSSRLRKSQRRATLEATTSSVIVKWYAPAIYAKVQKEEKTRMNRAVRHVRNAVIRRIGVKYPPASERGTPPHLRTGYLRNSISTEVVDEGGQIVGRVGTNARYAKYLELPEYLDRSFLLSTVEQEQGAVANILTGNPIL